MPPAAPEHEASAAAPPSGRWPRLLRPLDAPWIDPARARAAFDVQNQDPPGRRVHLALALLFCFVASFPITFAEVALVLVALAPFVRITMTWRMWPHLLAQPVTVLALAWLAWQMVTIAWSPDPDHGWRLVGEMRWALLLLAIWPMIEYRRWLIAAWALGFLAGHATQLIHALSAGGLIDGPTWNRAPNRISGWWEPVGGGTILCAALGLHAGAAVFGRGWWRALALAAAALTLLGILATGTRGAWLAAGATIAIALLIAGIRLARARSPRWILGAIGAVAAALAVVGAGAWLLAGDEIRTRVERAHTEITRALEHRDYDTDTGGRILMWRQAWRAWTAHPIRGVGLGGYQSWARADAETSLNPPPPPDRIHDHAHGMVPHVAAETGIVGLAIIAALAAAGLRGAATPADPGRVGYARAPVLALAGLLLAATFESIPVVSRASIHFWLLLALCPAWRPLPRRVEPTPEPGEAPAT